MYITAFSQLVNNTCLGVQTRVSISQCRENRGRKSAYSVSDPLLTALTSTDILRTMLLLVCG